MKNNSTEIGEFDDYPIPAYDPTIPQDERERLKAAALKDLETFVNKTKTVEKTAN